MRTITLTPLLLLIALAVSACGLSEFFTTESDINAPTIEVSAGDVNLTGTVTATVDDCAFDGICALIVETDSGTYQVNWAEGMMGCLGEYTGDVAVGDTVDVFAETREPGTVSICGGEAYFIRKQGQAQLPLTPIGEEGPPMAQPGGETLNLTGTVTATVDDCAFDGICALIVETDNGTYQVNWAEGMMGCLGEYTGDVAIGDTVDVFAEAREPGTVSICSGEQFYIRKA